MAEPTLIADLMHPDKLPGLSLAPVAEEALRSGRVAHLVSYKKLKENLKRYNIGRPLRDQVRGPERWLMSAILLALEQANGAQKLILARQQGKTYLAARIDPAGLADHMGVHVKTVNRNLETLLKSGIARDFGKAEGYDKKIGILADLVATYQPAKSPAATGPALGARASA
jgi:hypothetical protein